MMALAKAYDAMDASLAEINPFILTKDGKVYALDAKINFDDNALYPAQGAAGTARPERRRSAGSGSVADSASTTSSWMATWAAW